MRVDIKTIISNIEKPVSIDWFIYSDSKKQDLIYSKKDDRSGSFVLDVDLDLNNDYYLAIKAYGEVLALDLGPYIISDKEIAKISSNTYVNTPYLSVSNNKDKDGNIVSYTFNVSEFESKYPYKDTVIKIKLADAVVYEIISKSKSITLDKSKFSNGDIYEISVMDRTEVGLTSNIGKYFFTVINDEMVRYYTINNQDCLVDKLIEYYLDRSKILNNVITENLVVSLLIQSLRKTEQKVENIRQDYAAGKDIKESILDLETAIENTVNDLNIDGIGDKSIVTIINELKKKYKI